MERVHAVTDLERLNNLKGFEVALESFLNRYADAQAPQATALEGIERLDQILKESRMGARTRVQVEEWMQTYGGLAGAPELPVELRRRISHMLLDVQSRLTDQTKEGLTSEGEPDNFALNDARERFLRWRDRSGSTVEQTFAPPDTPPENKVVADASESAPKSGAQPNQNSTKTAKINKVTLRRSAEKTDENLTGAFFETLWSEMEYLEHVMDSGEHALTILDEMLSCADAKIDPMYQHLAASFIYFLKQRGYKMAPYVQRLREISIARETAT